MGREGGRYTGCHGATGRVDVHVDWFLGVIGFEEEELCDDGGGDGPVYLTLEIDDAFLDDGQRVEPSGCTVYWDAYLE
jgi:hypothetical protein